MADTLLIAAGVLCLLLGFVGSIVPVLPGPPLAYAGLIALHLTDKVQLSSARLLLGLVLVVGVLTVDAVVPAVSAKRWGGSRWGIWGCLAGTCIGLLFFPPFGFVVGSFLGAVVGELVGGKRSRRAVKAGVGAFMGLLLGTVLKLVLCGVFAVWFARALLAA